MKVIEINRYADATDSRDTAAAPVEAIDALLLTDSSCVLPGRPLFLPEFSARWELYLAPAVRISRLGKFIGERFAYRYYDAVSVVARLRPLDAGCRGACAVAFDSALMLGQWVETDTTAAPAARTIALEGIAETTVESGALGIDSAIAALSRRFTLKTGDIIIPGRTSLAVAPQLNTHISASLDGVRVLDFNVK